jgi:hypothetical protein
MKPLSVTPFIKLVKPFFSITYLKLANGPEVPLVYDRIAKEASLSSLPRELIWWREAVRFWFFAHDLLFEDGKQLRMRLPRWAGPVDLSQLNISF